MKDFETDYTLMAMGIILLAIIIATMLLLFGCATGSESVAPDATTPLGILLISPNPPAGTDVDAVFMTGRADACKLFNDACSVSPSGWRLQFMDHAWECPECNGQQHNVCAATYPGNRTTKVCTDGWQVGWKWESKNISLILSGHGNTTYSPD